MTVHSAEARKAKGRTQMTPPRSHGCTCADHSLCRRIGAMDRKSPWSAVRLRMTKPLPATAAIVTPPSCPTVVGRISNVGHASVPIDTAMHADAKTQKAEPFATKTVRLTTGRCSRTR